MGEPKAWLPFGVETSLQRVVRIVSQVVQQIAVVAAPHQPLPDLPDEVLIVRDPREGLGPLAGIALGLETLSAGCTSAFVCGCDTPLLQPAFINAMFERLGDNDLAVPFSGDFYHPLGGVYRTSLAARAWELVDANQLRPLFLIQQVHAVKVPVEDLRLVDPQLDSLENMNTPEDYTRLLAKLN